MNKKCIKKAIILPDIHYPLHSKECIKLIKKFMVDFDPDYLIYQGDQLNLDCVSSWNVDKPLLKESQRLLKEYDNFNNDILENYESVIKKSCQKVFLIGNHEHRVRRYVERSPELEGIIEPEVCLNLKKRGYKVVPYNGVYKLGKLNIIHGFYYNTYHAAKTVNAFEGNVCYAHVHSPQEFTKTTPLDSGSYHAATSLPCLCNLSPEYMKNRPNDWVLGFGVVYLLPNGNYFLYRIIIINNSFVFNGKYYKV